MRKYIIIILFTTLVLSCFASDMDEFRIKREQVFDFTEKPTVTRSGDKITVRFETKGFCDATVAVEDREGKIIRHLASGVLGKNAPLPFQKNTKKQTIIWDGKDDQERYVDDKDALTIRVSLGLKPRLEKKIYGDPKRRIGFNPPKFAPAPEGMYVFDSRGTDFLRLFDHEGNYIKTIYPFDADKLSKVMGLKWHVLPQTGKRLPYKFGFTLASFLTSGTSSIFNGLGDIKHGRGIAATAIAVRNGRIALSYLSLNRFMTDGTTGGLPLKGGKTGYRVNIGSSYGGNKKEALGPSSTALSPDGKTLYMTGYLWKHGGAGWKGGCLNGVAKLDYEKGEKPKVFVGTMTSGGHGTGNDKLAVPTSVACDNKGRVYISDHWNDRIQIFSPQGKHLKSVPVFKPAKVMVHAKTGDIWVASFLVFGVPPDLAKKGKTDINKIKPALTRFGPFENPKKLGSWVLPLDRGDSWSMLEKGQLIQIELDSYADQPTLWMAGRKLKVTAAWVGNWSSGTFKGRGSHDSWRSGGIRLLTLKNNKWEQKRSFSEDVAKSSLWVTPPDHSSQRLHVNPKTGLLYVHEQRHPLKSFIHLIEINAETGKKRLVQVPFSSEDLAFDLNGLAYLRTDTEVVRFEIKGDTWREVPWDYGEERKTVGFSYKGNPAISALPLPGRRPVCYNMGGMWVSPKGYVAVACVSRFETPKGKQQGDWKSRVQYTGRAWKPKMYPGRIMWDQIHVWDKHGKLIFEDAFPGIWRIDALAMDKDDDLYVLANATRILDGKMYPNEMVGTLIKVTPGKAKVVGTNKKAVIPLEKGAYPKRDHDIRTSKLGKSWVEGEGLHWFYGGVGYGGFNTAYSGGGCACWHARFTLDLFTRSFAPETEHFSVAVLDSNGNLILRIGRYGNEDSLGPKSRIPLGGDEVGLMLPMYLAAHTDRRLFIADAGNARILSVKLGYHTEEKVPLKNIPDRR